jgi:hypothetical protein
VRHALAVNGAFLLAAWVAQSSLWGPMRMLAAAGLVLGLPGIAWLPAFRVLMTPARAALVGVGISCASALAGGLACAAFGGSSSAWPFLIWTAIAINAGVVLSRRAVDFELGARWGVLAGVFVLGFLATSTVALRVVPPFASAGLDPLHVREIALIGTRAPSAFLAGLVLALLVDLVRRASGSLVAGLAAAAIYATVPETIVRHTFAYTFIETVFVMLVAVMLFAEADLPRAPAWLAGAGVLMAVLDRRTVVLLVGVAVWYGGLALLRRTRPDARAVGLVVGFAAGALLSWAYGAWTGAPVGPWLGFEAPSLSLWRRFLAGTGYVIPVIGLLAAVAALVWRRDERDLLLALWALSAAEAGTLMTGLLPLVALAVVVAARPGRFRWVAAVALAGGTALNLAADLRL